MAVQFRLLGDFEARIDGRVVDVGHARQRSVLVALLVDANRVVPVDQLVDRVWTDRRPLHTPGALYNYLSRLRRVLAAAGDVGIARQHGGYLLRVDPLAIDLHRFRHLIGQARTTDNDQAAARLYAEALALWQGEAFATLDTPWLNAVRGAVDNQRLAAELDRNDLELRLGRHTGLLGELSVRAATLPLDERLGGQLMLALYRCGRQADALDLYQRTRRRLAEDLGTDPGPALQQLHQRILTADPALNVPLLAIGPAPRQASSGDEPGTELSATLQRPPGAVRPGADPSEIYPSASNTGLPPDTAPTRPAGSAVTVPAQLPAAVAAFAGRGRELASLDRLLTGRTDPPTATVVSAIVGTAGVGKTALAVHWAHRMRTRFPDGQLYVNLRGYATAVPLRPLEALASFLEALGVPPDQVPLDTERAAAMYRTMLADRCILVVLDNARSADQVRPLLPGGSACVVLITSRNRLGGLVAQDGAAHLTLGMLTPPEAAALLERVLGARASAERDAVAELARRCAYLPLALRIAAAYLTLHPRRTVVDYLDRLGAAGYLDEMTAGDDDATVRVAFDLSYQSLDEPARQLFRRLGLAPGADITVDDAAALGDLDPYVAGRLLDRLAGAHLIEESQAGRYAFHDLLRRYAAEQNPPADRDIALNLLYGRYVDLARSAAALLYPHMLLLPHPEPTNGHTHAAAALAWLETERANLVQAVEAAARTGPRRAGWVLADALRGAFHLSRHTTDWLTMAEAALAAASADLDRAGEAAARQSLGTAQRSIGAYPDALRHYTEALRLTRDCGWAESEATNLGNLGIVCRKLGRLSEAAEHLHAALTVDRRIGRRSGETNNLVNLAAVYQAMGRLPEAAAAYRTALARNTEAGIVHGEALARTGLGQVETELGRHDEARDHLDRALNLYRSVGDRDGESVARSALATVECALDQPGAARKQATAALARAREVGDPQSETMALNALGRADRLLGDVDEALADHDAAYQVAHRTADRCGEAEALIGLAEAHRQAGRPGYAASYASRARVLAEQGGLSLVADRAAAILAFIHAGANGV